MDLPLDVKKQLMQMAGIDNVNEFDKMAAKVATKASESVKAGSESQASNLLKRKPHSPFQGNTRMYQQW